ncbi:hypothetical protein LHFGNBLO_006588 (plasmid) [Mesorhizobium sp. AR10]|uniref:hypothetical protein n=1 Tax=Mesorhizobium sp. AR10 TaxID=2865839 RepID=UPI00215E33EC|nr:hypothetical protein [Mesorhizobium sp. AR10]UVK35724.1 hypothetical protein LHFGNBLO_006588 [Mesorhizobium sp. AR10]
MKLPRDAAGAETSDYRVIAPAETLLIDNATGAVVEASTPADVRFRDAQGRIKPVSPFLEVWAQCDGSDELEPLTLNHLAELGGSVASLSWRVRAGNLKVFRRTGEERDKVEADTGAFSDHAPHALVGRSPNFKPGKTISFGEIRFLKPTEAFPEIRLRFLPGKGLVFGPRAGDPHVTDDVYFGATSVKPMPRASGRWDRYYISDPGTPPFTAPADIFQGESIGVNGSSKLSHGYLDDSCDGIAEVTLALGGQTFSAYGRFASAIPDFAPDSLPVRSIADDIEQMALGPGVTMPPDADGQAGLLADVRDILRRGLDTMRQINTAVHNGDEPVADVASFRNNMPGQEQGSYNRSFEPIFSPAQMASYPFALNVHKGVLERANASPDFANAFAGGMAHVRLPEDVADLTTPKRRLMPAMMRGNEGLELALTRRMIAKLALADPTAPPGAVVAAAVPAADNAAQTVDYASATRPIFGRVRGGDES